MLSLTLAFNCAINCTLQYNFLMYFLKCNYVCGKKLSVFWWQNPFLLCYIVIFISNTDIYFNYYLAAPAS